MKIATLFFTIIVLMAGAAIADDQTAPQFDELCQWMTGSFSSQQQAARDSEFTDYHLEMHQIWVSRTDGYWLYIEQTIAGKTDEPYRQRIAKIAEINDSTFNIIAYAIPAPERFVGGWDDSTLNNILTPDSLSERDGCEITVWPTSKIMFSGSTTGHNCPVSFKGSVYATSEITISPKMIYRWDRGYDADGNQVWGTERSGYFFRRTD